MHIEVRYVEEGEVKSVVTTVVAQPSIRQVAQLIELLQRGGVGDVHVQRVIDDVALRNAVIRLMRGQEEPLVDMHGQFDQAAMEKFIQYVFGKKIRAMQFKHDDARFELQELGFDPMKLATTEIIKDLLDGLDAFHAAVAVLRSGLLDGKPMLAREVAQKLGAPLEQVSQARAGVTKHVMARQQSAYPFDMFVVRSTPSVEGISIEQLSFSTRTYYCLYRAGILTLEQLAEQSEEDLFSIRNFGRGSLQEVEAALSSRGYSLKSS